MDHKKILIINIVIIFSFIIMIGFASNRYNKEVDTWNMAIKENSINSINTYVQKYPKGIFINSAKFILDELTWNEAVLYNTEEFYKNYIKLFPNGEYTTRANSMLKKYSDQLSHIFDYVSGSKIYFKDSNFFDTKLEEPEYIGEIIDNNECVFYVFSARVCIDCDANPSIYVMSKTNRNKTDMGSYKGYSYPGTERYYENNELIYKARAFYGKVLNNTKGIIWYQIYNNTEESRSYFLVSVSNGIIKSQEIGDYDTNLRLTLSLKKKGLCKEINGREYSSEP